MTEITRILAAIDQGDQQAIDELLPLVYRQLRQLAAQKLAQERPGQTLQATALVHEAYLKLVGSLHHDFCSRTHFFAAAAEAMRRILVDNARRKQRVRHGGQSKRVALDEAEFAANMSPVVDLIALDEALDNLSRIDRAKADLVKLRYFGGLTVEQAAQALGISQRTASRYWDYARSWLLREMGAGDD